MYLAYLNTNTRLNVSSSLSLFLLYIDQCGPYTSLLYLLFLPFLLFRLSLLFIFILKGKNTIAFEQYS